jgi:hypothetical protein
VGVCCLASPRINCSHLLFAHETLIFYWADPNQLHLQGLFLCLKGILGLKINLAVLELVPIRNVDNMVLCAMRFLLCL